MSAPVVSQNAQDLLTESEAVPLISRKLVCPACDSESSVDYLKAPDRFHGRNFSYDLRRCQSCSLVWVSNPPSPEELGSHYGSDYHKAITTASETSPKRWEAHKKSIARFKSGGSVLDIGCSSGSFLNSIKGSNWKLHGIEISPDEAARARERTGAQVFVGDILNADFPENSFDLVTSFDVLEHMYNPKECLKKVAYWLKPGGVFYVFIPNIEAWEASFFSSYWFGLELPRHLCHFGPESLRKLTSKAGLFELSLSTPNVTYAEYSIRYLYDESLRRMGFRREPLSAGNPVPFAWKVIRKLFRLTALSAFSYASSVSVRAAAIEGIFIKPGK